MVLCRQRDVLPVHSRHYWLTLTPSVAGVGGLQPFRSAIDVLSSERIALILHARIRTAL